MMHPALTALDALLLASAASGHRAEAQHPYGHVIAYDPAGLSPYPYTVTIPFQRYDPARCDFLPDAYQCCGDTLATAIESAFAPASLGGPMQYLLIIDGMYSEHYCAACMAEIFLDAADPAHSPDPDSEDISIQPQAIEEDDDVVHCYGCGCIIGPCD